MFHVYLADVGEELYAVEMSFLHPIPSKFVERLPFQAITMKVSHVMPTEAEEGERIWTNGAQELTESLVLDANAKAKLLEVSVSITKIRACYFFCFKVSNIRFTLSRRPTENYNRVTVSMATSIARLSLWEEMRLGRNLYKKILHAFQSMKARWWRE